MTDTTKFIGAIAIIALLLGIVIAWEVYAYGDCRAVGHSRLYCIMRIAR